MATTLTYGRKIPANGEAFWTILADNITRDDAHNHDGSNSARLGPSSLTPTTQTISSGSWSNDGGGNYSQVVTMSGSLVFDNVIMMFKIDDDIVHPTIEKQSSNTYKIYTNDNSKDIVAVYL